MEGVQPMMKTDKMTLHGVVRGRTIELDEKGALKDGQSVSVTFETASSPNSPAALEEFRRAAAIHGRFSRKWNLCQSSFPQ
jgi:hypothetical protein